MQLKSDHRLVNNIFWPIIMLVLGMTMVIYQSVGFDLSAMPGDLGDGRFNNYLLEHGYQSLINDVPYWNASFFFPEKDVISYSDNLFGALPIYVVCRFWVDRETAFQLWYLILAALNFAGCYYALRKLDFSVYACSVGAFIYAFSLIILIQTAHIQMLPRFAAPFAIVSLYLWLREKNNNYFYITVFLLAYQYYCGIYLGYFLLYALLIIAAVYFIKERKADALMQLFNTKKEAVRTTAVVFLAVCLMGILFYPYYLRSLDGDGYPPISVIKYYSPRLWSYVFVNDRSILWGWSADVIEMFNSKGAFNEKTCLFIGALPYGFLIMAFVKYRKYAMLRFFITALVVMVLFTLIFFNVSLYSYIIFLIPGARAIRAVSRYITIAVFFWSLISAFFLDRFLVNLNTSKIVFIFLLPLLLVIDNMNMPKKIIPLKSNFQKRCQSIVDKFEKAKHTNPTAKAFAVNMTDSTTIEAKEGDMRKLVQYHVDVMMASQIIGLPCVNGYSAKTPPDYNAYFLHPNEANLNNWLHSNRVRATNETYSVNDILILK